jgi:hypothetical protein
VREGADGSGQPGWLACGRPFEAARQARDAGACSGHNAARRSGGERGPAARAGRGVGKSPGGWAGARAHCRNRCASPVRCCRYSLRRRIAPACAHWCVVTHARFERQRGWRAPPVGPIRPGVRRIVEGRRRRAVTMRAYNYSGQYTASDPQICGCQQGLTTHEKPEHAPSKSRVFFCISNGWNPVCASLPLLLRPPAEVPPVHPLVGAEDRCTATQPTK